MEFSERHSVDLFVNQFWRLGYFTVRRRFGKYLPEPNDIGNFKVDIIGKRKNNYAIGIILTKEDFASEKLVNKLEYLATRHTKYSNSVVQLFAGVPESLYQHAKKLLKQLNEDIRRNIKLIQIIEMSPSIHSSAIKNQKPFFS